MSAPTTSYACQHDALVHSFPASQHVFFCANTSRRITRGQVGEKKVASLAHVHGEQDEQMVLLLLLSDWVCARWPGVLRPTSTCAGGVAAVVGKVVWDFSLVGGELLGLLCLVVTVLIQAGVLGERSVYSDGAGSDGQRTETVDDDDKHHQGQLAHALGVMLWMVVASLVALAVAGVVAVIRVGRMLARMRATQQAVRLHWAYATYDGSAWGLDAPRGLPWYKALHVLNVTCRPHAGRGSNDAPEYTAMDNIVFTR